MKKHKLLALGIAFLSTSSLIGCNQKTVTVTFNAGIGTFPDGSRVKTMNVKPHTKISDLNIPAPSYEGYTTNSWVNSSGESNDDVVETTYTILMYASYGVDNLELMKDNAIGLTAKALMDAIARQPEAKGKLESTFMMMQTYFDAFMDGVDAMALGKIGNSAMDAIARQPEASGKIQGALFYSAEVILNCPNKDGRTLGIGKTGSSVMDAIARQPEATSKILEIYTIACAGIYNATEPYGAAFGIGYTGGAAADAIARQPEASSAIINDLMLTIYYVNHGK